MDSIEYLLSYIESYASRSTCKPYDVTILTIVVVVVVVCNESVLSVVFGFFKH